MGFLLGLLILLQSFSIQPAQVVEAEGDQTEQAENVMKVGIDDAVPSTGTAIELGFQSFLIEEFEFEEFEIHWNNLVDGFSQAIEKTFKVVFRLIISPNAP